VVFVTEGKKKDNLDRSQVTAATGGDERSMRGMWGHPFKALILPTIVWVSNFSPSYDNRDKALAARLYAVSCDAEYRHGAVAADATKGVFPRLDPSSVQSSIAAKRQILALMLLAYARRFADAGFQLDAAPAGAAKKQIEQSGTAAFSLWFLEHYVSTLKPGGGGFIDWGAHGKLGATALDTLINEFQQFTKIVISQKEAREQLAGIAFPVVRIVNKPHDVDFPQGVKARRRVAADDDGSEPAAEDAAPAPDVPEAGTTSTAGGGGAA